MDGDTSEYEILSLDILDVAPTKKLAFERATKLATLTDSEIIVQSPGGAESWIVSSRGLVRPWVVAIVLLQLVA